MTRPLRPRRSAMAFGALLVAVAATLAGCRSAGDPVPERVTFGNQGVGEGYDCALLERGRRRW